MNSAETATVAASTTVQIPTNQVREKPLDA
jgi:hypothetical protein